MVTDEGTFEEWDKGLTTKNPLHYKGYEEKLEGLQKKYGLDEAVITGKARIDGTEVAIGRLRRTFPDGQHGPGGWREGGEGGPSGPQKRACR